jgi:glycosyltransferase involved in cell wall biosynthesis
VENWNHAIRQTRGDYIAWCSDDDRFLPDHLEASMRYLDAHPDVGLVHSGFIDVVETEVRHLRIARPLRFAAHRILRPSRLPWYLLRYYDWPFHPSTIVMRRRVWNEVGPFDSAYALADTDWFARAAGRYPVAMLARHGVLNRRHPGNWSNRLGSARMQNEIRTIVERALDRQYPKAPLRRAAWKQLWRANVRLRLALTLAARLKMRREDPARAAWAELTADTILPKSLAYVGEKSIEIWCRSGGAMKPEDPRESVSPL